MFIVIIQILGVYLFLVGSLLLGKNVRKYPYIEVAERNSRISHLLFYFCLVIPGLIGVFYPGLTHYDEVIGIQALPFQTIAFVVGTFAILIGIYYMTLSNKSLANIGKGAAAFKLTKHLVNSDVYNHIRNPMSLGYYLICLGVGLMAGSTYLTLGTILVLVPAHVFNLKYFEEKELEIRYGQSYNNYKKDVPFIIPRFNFAVKK